jgi:hypothetical protein
MNATNTRSYSAGFNPTFQIVGGLVQRTLDPSSYGSKGWVVNSNFDAQLAAFPPPFFPTSNGLAPASFVQEVLH